MSCLSIALSMTEKMYIELKKKFYSLDVQHCIFPVIARAVFIILMQQQKLSFYFFKG